MAWMLPPTGIVMCHNDVSENITQREGVVEQRGGYVANGVDGVDTPAPRQGSRSSGNEFLANLSTSVRPRLSNSMSRT